MRDVLYILVSGGRDYDNYEVVDKYLGYIKSKYEKIIVIHGAARGLDSLAALWVLNQKDENINQNSFLLQILIGISMENTQE